MTNALRVRRSIQELQADYEKGNKQPLEDLMRAWKGVKELPPEDPRSFFMIGGFHGEPFRGGGWGSNLYWGGYCHHGNILFPTWHRMYLVKLEEALRSIQGCEDVTLPYWDETSDDSIRQGIPWALTAENFELDGKTIPNPLRSFVFPKNIVDNVSADDGTDPNSPNYTKLRGYETVRYPLSGLVGTDKDRKATEEHNAKFKDAKKNVEILNQNIVDWLGSFVVINGEKFPTNVAQKYKDCLNAPNYTVFSNMTSAQQWNDDQKNPDGTPGPGTVVPLESPHNSIHLAVGGFETPKDDWSPIDGANGDMGENDTAGLDPIFFFHHCHVDRVFWLWQKKQGFTDHLEVIGQYPGTNSADNQGPTPGVAPNTWLTLDTPLDPFKHEDGRPYTSQDCINIERQLGFTYSQGSLEGLVEGSHAAAAKETKGRVTGALHVTGVNRARIRGSFLISAFAVIDGKRQHLGTEAVLSRWNVQGCANCQTHLETSATFPLPADLAAALTPAAAGTHALTAVTPAGNIQFGVVVHGRDGVLFSNLPSGVPEVKSTGKLAAASVSQNAPMNRIKARIEVR
ncbi:tyrosinase family protein [Stigmatella erecta]|uniref:Tyrosinase n=1 Tax=Stigmatella erecta TaxID=83460 RepID=A0A1I0KUA0_9BACT|nr:tyrosinase family protein [Stigmatella erecta]SEU29518.1 tyrosinase [Stigmatella erecta]